MGNAEMIHQMIKNNNNISLIPGLSCVSFLHFKELIQLIIFYYC